MITVLKYESYSSERCAVNRILAANCIEIIKTKMGIDHDRITIRISGNDELCELLEQLNEYSSYGVIVLKTKSENGFSDRLKKIFNREMEGE